MPLQARTLHLSNMHLRNPLKGAGNRMTDLIWIGNALSPRWVAFAACAVVILALAAFAVFMTSKEK
jgi:hypothetical protein